MNNDIINEFTNLSGNDIIVFTIKNFNNHNALEEYLKNKFINFIHDDDILRTLIIEKDKTIILDYEILGNKKDLNEVNNILYKKELYEFLIDGECETKVLTNKKEFYLNNYILNVITNDIYSSTYINIVNKPKYKTFSNIFINSEGIVVFKLINERIYYLYDDDDKIYLELKVIKYNDNYDIELNYKICQMGKNYNYIPCFNKEKYNYFIKIINDLVRINSI